ncbi:Protein MAIN-LIKE 1 [Glycine soja]
MVRTRGLGHAIGRVIGISLGREDHHDSDDVPQRRRPIASARRQWEVAPVAEDVPVVAGDVHTQGAEAGHDAEGFPSGPCDPSVLTEYGDHVAVSIWNREERPELKLFSHGRKVQKFGRPAPEIEGLVDAIGLSPLIVCSVEIGDRGLISAFVERWHKETSSFHLPVGEVTITLDDVASLLHLPIIGAFHTFEPLHVDEVVLMLVELLEVSGEEARIETTQCHGAYVRLSWLRDIYQRRCQAGHWTVAAHAYLLHLLGCILFANKSATHVHVVFLDAFRDFSQSGSYAWGASALLHMYDHLNDACKSGDRQLAGYITLLQCWIYEHFPSVVECLTDPDYDELSPRACRWIAMKASLKSISASTYRQRLDGLRIPDVCWMPYAAIGTSVSFEEIDDRWMHYSDHLAPADPPRHPPLTHDDTFMEPYIPQVPMAPAVAPTYAPSNVEQPRHAVDACQAIAERLEHLLNLRIVTADTVIHEIMKDCIRIVRGVTPDGNVYVRSQRRRRTDQP